ncbi:hypothetical protein SNEBB_003273 [Seison nebaliae]|nr:hypothetical protein SNEBB_003273 [Seison nebaliae]
MNLMKVKARKLFKRTCICDGVCSCEDIFNSPLLKFKRRYRSLYSRKHLYDAYACFIHSYLGVLPPSIARTSFDGMCHGLCCHMNRFRRFASGTRYASYRCPIPDHRYTGHLLEPEKNTPYSTYQSIGGCKKSLKEIKRERQRRFLFPHGNLLKLKPEILLK